ncbi:uncharacterized protein FOMMEDRAFT_64150, partial [Fomitiporia mediterranea MF3/22]
CSRCSAQLSEYYRCLNCSRGRTLCKECILEQHTQMVLHCIEEIKIWSGSYWKPTSLHSIGMVVYLNHQHSPEKPICYCPATTPIKFTVLDVTGIHSVCVVFCGCSILDGFASRHYVQLLHYGWFPATPQQPRTAISFTCLNDFHILSLQGKVTGYNYYKSLIRKTDNT